LKDFYHSIKGRANFTVPKTVSGVGKTDGMVPFAIEASGFTVNAIPGTTV
jgi:hypothetical protein